MANLLDLSTISYSKTRFKELHFNSFYGTNQIWLSFVIISPSPLVFLAAIPSQCLNKRLPILYSKLLCYKAECWCCFYIPRYEIFIYRSIKINLTFIVRNKLWSTLRFEKLTWNKTNFKAFLLDHYMNGHYIANV